MYVTRMMVHYGQRSMIDGIRTSLYEAPCIKARACEMEESLQAFVSYVFGARSKLGDVWKNYVRRCETEISYGNICANMGATVERNAW